MRLFRPKTPDLNPAIKDATINRDLSVLRHILHWAVTSNCFRPTRWRA
jgi:hypothetical protein